MVESKNKIWQIYKGSPIFHQKSKIISNLCTPYSSHILLHAIHPYTAYYLIRHQGPNLMWLWCSSGEALFQGILTLWVFTPPLSIQFQLPPPHSSSQHPCQTGKVDQYILASWGLWNQWSTAAQNLSWGHVWLHRWQLRLGFALSTEFRERMLVPQKMQLNFSAISKIQLSQPSPLALADHRGWSTYIPRWSSIPFLTTWHKSQGDMVGVREFFILPSVRMVTWWYVFWNLKLWFS